MDPRQGENTASPTASAAQSTADSYLWIFAVARTSPPSASELCNRVRDSTPHLSGPEIASNRGMRWVEEVQDWWQFAVEMKGTAMPVGFIRKKDLET